MIDKLLTRQGLSSLAISFFILLLPFQWLRIAPLGSRSVIWVAMAVVVFVAAMTFKSTLLQNLFRFISRAKVFHLGLVCYIAVYVVVALIGDDPKAVIVRLVAAYGQFLLVGALAENLSKQQLVKTLTVAFPLSFLAIVGYANWVFVSQGTNLLTELAKALATGSHRQVTSRVVRAIVDASQVASDASAADKQNAGGSVRNFFGCYINLAVFALLTALPSIRNSGFLRQALVLGTLAAAPPILLIVLMSRSAMLSLAVGLGIASVLYVIQSLASGAMSKIGNALAAGAALCLVAVAIIPMQLENQSVLNVIDRFTEIASDMRVEHYRVVLDRTLEKPWWGNGASEPAPDGYQVHNYFLGAWYQVGIAGLIATFLAWFGLSLDAARRLNEAWGQRDERLVNLFFAAALLVGPLLRRLIAGDCGRFTLVELIAIAMFFILIGKTQAEERGVEYHVHVAEDEDDRVFYRFP